MHDAQVIVKACSLSKHYGSIKALDGLDFEIRRGVILGLLGPNGSGKTTLLKAMCGMVRPTSGEVTLFGQKPSHSTKELVAYLPEIDYLYPWMSAAETVQFVSGFFRDWSAERAQQLMEQLEIPARTKVRDLSRGLRARLKLVLALAREVPLVLLDEPLSGIDISSRAKIIRAIVGEYRTGEQTIVLSTHQVQESESIFEEVMFLRSGKIVLSDQAEHLRQQHNCSIQDMWEKVYDR